MGIVSGGGGGSATLTPPVTLTGTNPATVPLTVKGAMGQHVAQAILEVTSQDGTDGLKVGGDGASGVGDTALASGLQSFALANSATTPANLTASGMSYSNMNAAPGDGTLFPGDFSLWLDQTNGAAKLMIKAKSANGTVVTAAIALA